MATNGWKLFAFPGGTMTPDQTYPRAVQYEVEFTGIGVTVWGTETGINSGAGLFDQDMMPLVGVTVTAGNDKRNFAETGNHGVVFREGAANADEQWSYRCWWDSSVGAWAVLVVFGGAVDSVPANTVEGFHDDGAVRFANITMIGPAVGWTP